MSNVFGNDRRTARSLGSLGRADGGLLGVALVLVAGVAGGLEATGGPLPAASATPDASALYARHCLSCHGKDGRAQTPVGRKLGVKDLSVSVASDADMERQLREGTRDARGVQRMPPFKDKLTAAEVQALIGHVKAFRK